MKKILVLGTALLLSGGIAFAQTPDKCKDKKDCTEKCEKPCCKKDKECKSGKDCKKKETKGDKS